MADPPRSDYDSPMAEAQQDDNTNYAANNNNDTNNQDDASDAATAVTAVYRPIVEDSRATGEYRGPRCDWCDWPFARYRPFARCGIMDIGL